MRNSNKKFIKINNLKEKSIFRLVEATNIFMKNKINKIKYQKILGIFILFILSFSVVLVSSSNNNEWPSFNFCCEKTKTGAWCQNTLEENCDNGINSVTNSPFRKTPTSCDSTSFCKKGCCVDSDEGLCMENTPEKVCELSTGTWVEDAECNIPQCNLGCCVLGDQASFVTLTRCKKLSGFYGLETNFRQDINNEADCILTAHFQDKGACVYEFENQKTCKFTTRKDCLNIKGENITSKTEFFKDYLCSNDELATNCGPTKKTTCIDGKDEIYFIDSCGNPANIYDSNKIYEKEPSYWQKIVPKSESCGFNNEKGNANSKTCGNCEYFKGSICSKGSAGYGDFSCKDLNCYNTENNNDYKNGESWCIDQGNVGLGRDVVGSRHFRHICINGEEITEPCSDFRNEVCIENNVKTSDGDFIESACRINRWDSCIDQEEETDCSNTDKRDCYWLKGVQFVETETSSTASSNKVFKGGATGVKDVITKTGVKTGGEACLPNIPPGLKFWNEGDASNICSIGNSVCIVEFEKGLLFGGKKCIKNCECLKSNWAEKMNNVCTSLGDCGAYVNIAGKATEGGAKWKINGKKRIIRGILNKVKTKGGI